MVCRIDLDTPELLAYGRLSDEIKKDAESLSEPYLEALFEALHESLQDLKWEHIPENERRNGNSPSLPRKGKLRGRQPCGRVSQLEKEVESLKKIISLKNAFPAPSPHPRRPRTWSLRTILWPASRNPAIFSAFSRRKAGRNHNAKSRARHAGFHAKGNEKAREHSEEIFFH